MYNNWKKIKKAYQDYQSLHTREYVKIPIVYYYSTCSICIRDDKARFRTYKNFLIYLANYQRLLNVINNTNKNFKKLRLKIAAYRNNVTKAIQKKF